MHVIHTEAVISRWLTSSIDTPIMARQEWDSGRHAVLRTGRVFDAVRMPPALVHAAVESTQPDVVSVALEELLQGPVICHPSAWYYALVPPGTCETWRSGFATVRGFGGWLTVPRLDRTVPASRLYWSVPARAVGTLCDPRAVERLLQAGHERSEGTAR